MSEFLLIHGSAHGAWCWHKVIPALQALGHTARAIDLPAHGNDPTPAGLASLDGYVQAILAALPRPAILVGHSMAGFPITAAADLAPDRITRLVYLCAYVPRHQQSLARMRRAGPRQPLAPAIRLSPDRVSFRFDPDQVDALFYHDCPPEDRALAREHLCAEPVLPQETDLILGPAHAGVPRFYIRCTEDRAIPPEYQETMARPFPPGQVSLLPTSHSPFFAAPVALAQRLSDIAGQPL